MIGASIRCPTCREATTVLDVDGNVEAQVTTICGSVTVPARTYGYWLACGDYVNAAGYELRSAKRNRRNVVWLESLPGAGT